MPDINLENKSLVFLAAIGFFLNAALGLRGYTLPQMSYQQLLCFQMADASAIMAAVVAARYVGIRSEHVAASGFILLGITHGISLSSAGVDSFNEERGILMIMPMIPTFILLHWCTLFPKWLRLAGLFPAASFLYLYVHVISGGAYYDTPLVLGYITWLFIELCWAYYLIKDWKAQTGKS
ncbi:MAG: hypothetical protein IPM92_00575 [Saprospiraceae bacterium]|nr:hypothetical protein [Saprospiraceae bacterium]